MVGKRLTNFEILVALSAALVIAVSLAGDAAAQDQGSPIFVPSDRCIGCHSNMVDAQGEALSIGHTWRASMMAQSAKDPYWQGTVRREIGQHPRLRTVIEDTCSVCHLPMFRTQAVANGRAGEILRYLEGGFSPAEHKTGADGVSCAVCHQISGENLGEHASFDGGYIIEPSLPEQGSIFGPHEVTPGLQRVMQSASALLPGEGTHIQSSELCATCHTLFTPAMNGEGEIIGQFPEQVPYLEWKHSAYEGDQSCQDCHMPEVGASAPITSVLGEPRENVSRHAFRGGNAFMLRILDRYRDELGITTPSADLEHSVQGTLDHLQSGAARVEFTGLRLADSEAVLDLSVTNLAGHKLPTAYPSRRAWLHVTVQDPEGKTIFESGALAADGSIVGNDNDVDSSAYEPHYTEITSAEQVQIYEPIIHDHEARVTTSLLAGVSYAKDNRLLPRGFDNSTADEAIRIRGAAFEDESFREGGDSIRYRVGLPEGVRTVEISVELLYQSIGYRWAHNLGDSDIEEATRFVGYYEANADLSAVRLAAATARGHRVRSR